MTLPNRENIDRWLFDYTEGNLSIEQEEILENYLLNNPDLEIDLDAWQEAKITPHVIENPNKDRYKKRRKIAPFYFAGIAFFMIAFGGILLLNFSDKNQNENSQNLEVKNENLRKKTIQSDLRNNSNLKESNLSNSAENQLLISNENNGTSANPLNTYNTRLNRNEFNDESNQANLMLAKHNSNQTTVDNINSLNPDTEALKLNHSSNESENASNAENKNSTESFNQLFLAKRELSSLKLDYYQIRNEELHVGESEDNESTENEGFNLNIGELKLFQKIEKVLEKDLGLSNIPDHTYSIPEYSNVDVLFSNIGATSQFRFQSTSTARWIENESQRKLSQQITLDGYSRGAQSGFGMQANYDFFANGSIQNWNTALMFSPKIALTRRISLEPALRFKIGNKLLNEDRIENHSAVNFESHTTNQFNFDSSLAIGSKLWYRDLDLGLTINTPYFYIGGQISNILKHNNNIYSNVENLDMRASNVFNAIIGTQYISRNQKIVFSPYCFFEKINSSRIFAGFSLKLNKFMIGGSYGSGNISSGTIGLSFKNFALLAQTSYGYVSALQKNSFTHQLTLRFNSNVDKKSRRYITF